MTARCASCSYPLSVSDSVSCFECLCHFHIDCAQLVGFPYYELSADPVRNTFLCTTCRLLPIPGRSQDPQCAADSDSDSEDTMPSRQLDYHHLEPPGDLARDMHDLKGTVQDLSDLCKDMLREINELKSINLALRCGVENLRHENEDKNKAIDELRKRLDALEGNVVSSKSNGLNNERINERLDVENNCISDSPIEENEDKVLECRRTNDTPVVRQKRNVEFSDSNQNLLECEKNTEKITRCSESIESEITEGQQSVKDGLNNSILSPERAKEKRKDWDWRGRRAVELNSSREESEVDEGETEESDIEEAEKAWETLHDEVVSQRKEESSDVSPSESNTAEETEQICSDDKLETEIISRPGNKITGSLTDDSARCETSIHIDDEITAEASNLILKENETGTSTEQVTKHSPTNYEPEEEDISASNTTDDEVDDIREDQVNFVSKCEGNDVAQDDLVNKSLEEGACVLEDISEYESENEVEEQQDDELVLKKTRYDVKEENTEKASPMSKSPENTEEQQDVTNEVVEEEKSASEEISDYEREEEGDDRSTNTLREDLDDVDALDEVDEGCVEDSDRLEIEESETLAHEERSFDKIVIEGESSAAGTLLDEKELMTRSSSLRSLLLDDVVEVEVGKIDEEAEESHDEDILENVAEEDADTDHELAEHNEEDGLANGDIELQVDEHLENNIDQDREEHLEETDEDNLEEADTRPEGEPRLSEGVEDEAMTEGEQRLGGQSPDLAGEVQPSDVPESHSPTHTEEDLWHYLKESVSMEHPHTVEEFLQSLIGTLQHVPEDLLQPVIVENIKRANSPCSQTDGERVNSSCSQHQDGESSAHLHQDGGSAAHTEALSKTGDEQATSPAEDDAGRTDESLIQKSSDDQEDDVTRDSEGYSIVEASA